MTRQRGSRAVDHEARAPPSEPRPQRLQGWSSPGHAPGLVLGVLPRSRRPDLAADAAGVSLVELNADELLDSLRPWAAGDAILHPSGGTGYAASAPRRRCAPAV